LSSVEGRQKAQILTFQLTSRAEHLPPDNTQYRQVFLRPFTDWLRNQPDSHFQPQSPAALSQNAAALVSLLTGAIVERE
jgi:hypothetical protein